MLAATSVTGPTHPGLLFYVHNRNSNTHFLVVTGAEVSVIPPTRAEHSHLQCAFSLQGVDGSCIVTYGVHSCTLNVPSPYKELTVAILGATFYSILASWLTCAAGLCLIRIRISVDGLPSDLSLASPWLSLVQQDSSSLFSPSFLR